MNLKRTFLIVDAILLVVLCSLAIVLFGSSGLWSIIAIVGAYLHGLWTGSEL